MQTIKRGRNTFYIKEHAVIVGMNNGFSYTAYTVYPLQNRKPFYDFKQAIIDSKEDELTTAIEIMRLGMKYKLAGVGTMKPKEAEENTNDSL